MIYDRSEKAIKAFLVNLMVHNGAWASKAHELYTGITEEVIDTHARWAVGYAIRECDLSNSWIDIIKEPSNDGDMDDNMKLALLSARYAIQQKWLEGEP